MISGYGNNNTIFRRNERMARVDGDAAFNTGSDNRSIRFDTRHRLTLHVRSHESAVTIIVFDEWNERSSNGKNLFGRNIDVIDFMYVYNCWLSVFSGAGALHSKVSIFVDRRCCRSCCSLLFRKGVQINNLACDIRLDRQLINWKLCHFFCELLVDFCCSFRDEFPFTVANVYTECVSHCIFSVILCPVFYSSKWCFNKTVVIDAAIGSQVSHQTNVRTFRRSNRTNASIMCSMHVTNVEARAFSRQTSRTHRGQTALVFKLGKRVGLIHELGQLRTHEEFAQRTNHWSSIDKFRRINGGNIHR